MGPLSFRNIHEMPLNELPEPTKLLEFESDSKDPASDESTQLAPRNDDVAKLLTIFSEMKKAYSQFSQLADKLSLETTKLSVISKALRHENLNDEEKLFVKSNFKSSVEQQYDDDTKQKLLNLHIKMEDITPLDKLDMDDTKEKYLKQIVELHNNLVDNDAVWGDRIERVNEFAQKYQRIHYKENRLQLDFAKSELRPKKIKGAYVIYDFVGVKQKQDLDYQRTVLKGKALVKEQQNTVKLIECTKAIEIRLQASEKYGIPPGDISFKMIIKLKKILAIQKLVDSERAFKLLNRDEKLNHRELKSPSPVKKKKEKKLPTPPKSVSSVALVRELAIVEPLSRDVLISHYLLSIHKRRCFWTIAPRVIRWETRSPDVIRAFTDKKGTIQRYLGRPDVEVLDQRVCHLSTGLDELLSDEIDRKIYSFPTQNGDGVIATITRKNSVESGIIYRGIENDIVYHKYFEKSSYEDVTQIFIDRHSDPVLSQDDDLAGWEATTKYVFTILENNVIKISYPGEDYSIEIFPVRSDFLKLRKFE